MTKITKKITRSQLAEAIGTLVRKAIMEKTENQGIDTGVGKFASNVDALMVDTIESIDKLVEEAGELFEENPTHTYAIQERNRVISDRVGILKGLKTKLVAIAEDLYRTM